MKKTGKTVLVLALLVLCLTTVDVLQAFGYLTGYTIATNVNVRAKPSTKAKVLANLKDGGQDVIILDTVRAEGRSWCKVEIESVNGKRLKKSMIGYIAEEFIEIPDYN